MAIAQDHDLERAIRERGEALLAAVEPERLIALTPEWWQERMMSWATEDPEFRTRLLRFVDVLPALRTRAAIADHVRQYFRDEVPASVRFGSALADTPLFRPVLSKVARAGVFAMADRFIGGESPRAALASLAELATQGTGYSVDLLGEATLSTPEADAYRERYLELVDTLSADGGPFGLEDFRKPNVSVKLSALTAHFEPAAPEATARDVLARLVPILERAREHGVFVNIDMEQHRYRDLVHEIWAQALRGEMRDWPDAGIVVQAYLRDAADDIARVEALARERGTPITVRLVKGAYWDEEVVVARQRGWPVPVFEDKAATDQNFERCTAVLVESSNLLPAFASHNPRSVAQAMVVAERAGLPKERVEFQFLYGMAEGLRKAVRDAAYRTRVYVPTGEVIPGMAYLVRRLLENTSNQSWLMNKHEEGDPETVLVAPEPAVREPEPAPAFANHPPAEFHRSGVRQAMADAIAARRDGFGTSVGPVIGGERVATGNLQEVRPPGAPGEIMGYIELASVEQARQAVNAARAGFEGWRDLGAGARAETLRRAAALYDAHRYELAATMVFECAKPWREADGDLTEAIDFLQYYAGEAERLDEGIRLDLVPAETNHYRYEPRGVVAVIAPWNFPVAIATGMTTGALAAGNAVVLKPAEESSLVAAQFVTLLHEAGVPRGALQFLPGRGEEVGAALVEDTDVDMVAFTGSSAVGLGIMEAAARVRAGQRGPAAVIAEMGGKNAIVIDDDADLDEAVAGVVHSAFGYGGQKCSACSRVIVVGAAYEPFRERLAAMVESLPVGPPEDPHTLVPPLISAGAQAKAERYIAIGTAEGRLLSRGPMREGGHYVAPHVFEEVPASSALTCDEVFGPVLALYRAETFGEAIEMALDSPFRLTGGVYSRNPRHVRQAGEEFRVGNLYINRPITGAMVGRHPFGGYGLSGTDDKAGGPEYVRRFMIPRVVTENTMRRGFAPSIE